MTEKIDKAQLKETIQSFQITNEELRAAAAPSHRGGGGGGVMGAEPAGLGLCEENCSPLLVKTEAAIEASSAVGRGKKWFLRLLTLAIGFLLVDVFVISKGIFEDSHTFRLLLAAGLSSAHVDQIVAKLEMLLRYSESSMSRLREWIDADLPVMYSDAVETLTPYLASLKEKASAGGVAMANFAADLADSTSELWASVASRVDAELSSRDGFAASASEKLTLLYEMALGHALWAWAHMSAHAAEVWAFIVAQWTLIRAALESNEAAMGVWLGVVEAWRLLVALVMDLVAQASAWCDRGIAQFQSMVK